MNELNLANTIILKQNMYVSLCVRARNTPGILQYYARWWITFSLLDLYNMYHEIDARGPSNEATMHFYIEYNNGTLYKIYI